MHRNHTLDKPRDTTHNVWGELEDVCRKIHSACYVKRNKTLAKRYLPKLQRVLDRAPEDDLVIVREEGLALLNELTGKTSHAIRHRKREIQLMQVLHKEVNSQNYSDRMKTLILVNRDERALQKRRTILRNLQRREP